MTLEKGIGHNCCRSVCVAHCRLVAGIVSGKHHPNSVEDGPWASGCGQLGKPFRFSFLCSGYSAPALQTTLQRSPPELASWEAHVSGGLLRASWHCGDKVTSHFSPQTQQQSLLCLLLPYVLKASHICTVESLKPPLPQVSLFLWWGVRCVSCVCVYGRNEGLEIRLWFPVWCVVCTPKV